MNTLSLRFATLAILIVSTMGVGCTTSVVIDAPSTPMTSDPQRRKALLAAEPLEHFQPQEIA